MHRDVWLVRITRYQLDPAKTRPKVEGMAAAAVKNRKLGLRAEVVEHADPVGIPGPDGRRAYLNLALVRFTETEGSSPEKADAHFEHAVRMLGRAGRPEKWEVRDHAPAVARVSDGARAGRRPVSGEGLPGVVRTPFVPPVLMPEVMEKEFAGIYGLAVQRWSSVGS